MLQFNSKLSNSSLSKTKLAAAAAIGLSMLLLSGASAANEAAKKMSTKSTCDSLPFDPQGDSKYLQAALQNATNTGKQVTLSGTYYISKDLKIFLRKNLLVDARRAKFIATDKLDGDMFSLDAHASKSQQCGAKSMMNIIWIGGEFNMAEAKVSQVVPIRKLTPKGRTGTKRTGDALSIRSHNKGLNKINHVKVQGIKVIGTKNDTDPYYLAGGDSGILMAGPKSAELIGNEFYGIRDAAIYASAAGDTGEIGDDYIISNNIVERAYDALTCKRGADRVIMKNNKINDVAVGLSIKQVFPGRQAHDVEMSNNIISNAARAISLERVKNVKLTNNTITEIGGVVANNPQPTNARGKHYEAIGLDGNQGNIVIENNTFAGVTGEREGQTNTYGIVARNWDGIETTQYSEKNNTFSNLDNNEATMKTKAKQAKKK